MSSGRLLDVGGYRDGCFASEYDGFTSSRVEQ